MDAAEADLAALRAMTPEQKLQVMSALWWQAWQLKTAGVRLAHPEWTDAQVTARVRQIFRDAPS